MLKRHDNNASLHSLHGASQENAEAAGKRSKFLTKDYTQCYTKGTQSKDKESREKVFEQVISRAAVHHACPEPW